uniref:Metadherin a n=1 Tax=Iconisemion striatum TaxID=60296 RepID=A0A1A7XWY6_9TELE
MAGDLQSLALEKVELLSSRLKELLTSGQGYVRAQFGVDLGLKPELYPTWVILSTAAFGLLLLLSVSWAAVCGGLLAGKKRRSPVNKDSGEPVKAEVNNKSIKPEEHKKKSRKKTPEKKTQSNGQPVVVAHEEVKQTAAVSITSQIKAAKVCEVQAPVQVKKNKKKAKPDVKPAQQLSINDGKEPDEGAWETKVSNREKRQQRRKEKGSEDSGSSGGAENPKTHVEVAVVTATTKKNRGNYESQHSRTTTKGEAASGAASITWREEPSVNGGGWSDVSSKIRGPMGSVEATKWTPIPAATRYRPQNDPQPWAQEAHAWSSVDGQKKNMSLPVLGRNPKDSELQWKNRPGVDDEWSGFNVTAATDPSSDWSAPVEHWGNYEEPPVLVAAASLQKDQTVPIKILEEDKDNEDPSETATSKKKRKKKKKTEEELKSDPQMLNTAAVGAANKTHELSVLQSTSKTTSISSSPQKKCEPTAELHKPSQKKKARRET